MKLRLPRLFDFRRMPAVARPRRQGADLWGPRIVAVLVIVWVAGFAVGFVNALGLAETLGFIAMAIGLRKPVVGLLGVSLLCTIDPPARNYLMTGGLLRFNTFNYFLLFVMVYFAGFVVRVKDLQSVLIKLLAVLLIFELGYTTDRENGTQHLLGLITTFGLLIYWVRAADDGRVVYWQGVVSGVAGAFGGLMYNMYRGDAPDMNYNAYALFPLTAILAACLGFQFCRTRRDETTLVLLAAVNYVWIFLSSSRGDLLISSVCLLFLIFNMRGVTTRIAYVALAAALVVAVSAAFGDQQENTWRRIYKLMDPEESADARTSGRSDLVIGGLAIFAKHPLGVGTGGFGDEWAGLGYVDGIGGYKFGEEAAAHSGWIKVLVENGLPGILLFGFFVCSFAFVGWKSGDRRARALGMITTATLLVAFTSTEFQGKGFWFLIAGTMSLFYRREYQVWFQGRRRQVPWRLKALPLPAMSQASQGVLSIR